MYLTGTFSISKETTRTVAYQISYRVTAKQKDISEPTSKTSQIISTTLQVNIQQPRN